MGLASLLKVSLNIARAVKRSALYPHRVQAAGIEGMMCGHSLMCGLIECALRGALALYAALAHKGMVGRWELGD